MFGYLGEEQGTMVGRDAGAQERGKDAGWGVKCLRQGERCWVGCEVPRSGGDVGCPGREGCRAGM